MLSLRGGSRVWSIALILCIAGSFVLSSTAFAGDQDADRFAGDQDADRFAGDQDADRFAPLSFGSITNELINLASTEVISRAVCAVLGYKAFSSVFDAEQKLGEIVVMEAVNKPELSKKVLRSKLAGCNPLLDLGL